MDVNINGRCVQVKIEYLYFYIGRIIDDEIINFVNS